MSITGTGRFTPSFLLQERLSHGISAGGFPGNHRTSDFQPPYFPPPFPSQQPTPQEVFAAQNAHLADPYANSLHSFQTSQVRIPDYKNTMKKVAQIEAQITFVMKTSATT